ncbi:uncharacterized protein F5891DRAFT_1068656 [Suillus fuscotomentosus]|nr:uncharacterized protein F5891DRAFT_1068656 [Suillus fuscotomentosus]KAG1891906.1 hypothetical protein F5891DRAFT_1068656 [Suillus fuscotomentosus]
MLRWWRRPVLSVMPGEMVPGETLFESGMNVLDDMWDSVKGLVRRRRVDEGYSQLSMEMSDSV